MINSLLADLARRGITIVANGGKLRYRPVDAMTTGLLARLREHRDVLVELFSNGSVSLQEVLPDSSNTPDESIECIDPPTACPTCRGLMLWWDLAGGAHCLECEPPTKSRKLMEVRQRILAHGGFDAGGNCR